MTVTVAGREALPTPSLPVVWADEITGPLLCTRILDVTHDVRSFELSPAQPLSFRPGEYLTLTVLVDGVEHQRCYTISSPPTRPDLLTITVKRVPDGPVSNWLHERLRVGDTVRASGPLGRFSMANHPASRYLFLSAGSGITPLMSMTRTLRDRPEPTDLVFVHNARTPDDIIFRSELDALAARADIAIATICEEDSPSERWRGARGRLSLPMLLAIAPDLLDREIFSCGPPPYMAAVRELLALAGVDPARCHEESFDLGADAPAAGDPDSATVQYTVELLRSRRTISCGSDTPVLDAAQQAGLTLPSSCGEGMCGTCKSTLLHGRVDMAHAGGIRPREIADNKILLCCSRPCEDLVIDA